MKRQCNIFEMLKIFSRGGIDHNANIQAGETKGGYDCHFLVDYIGRRIHVLSSAELAPTISDILHKSRYLTLIECEYLNGVLFKLSFSDVQIDDFIKIAEHLHNEYRRICGYQNGGGENGN